MTDQAVVPNAFDISSAREIGQQAVAARRRAIARVAFAQATPVEVVAEAATNPWLRSLRLSRLLSAQPAWGEKKTAAALQALSAPQTATIAWILDRRVPPELRLDRFIDLFHGRQQNNVWPGFPYTPYPWART